MTPENASRRDLLLRVERVVHKTISAQPVDDDAACGRVLASGIENVANLVNGFVKENAGA